MQVEDALAVQLETILPGKASHDYIALLFAGTAAMRNTKRGSWYVEALKQVFSERACDMHVADMLVQVNGSFHLLCMCSLLSTLLSLLVGTCGFLPLQVNALIKEREGYAPGTEFHRCKEMSEYCSTLCQHLYLFPGHPPT